MPLVPRSLRGRPGGGTAVVVALVGTDADPQGRADAQRLLAEAGASVFLSNAAATAHAVSLLGSPA